MPFKNFKCRQCGKCCLEYGTKPDCTPEDIQRWGKEGRAKRKTALDEE